MAKQFDKINNRIKTFIEKQKIFFVATAMAEGRINLSPKGMDSLRVLGENRVMWLNVTGSGNETAAHLLSSNRITIMFCSFEGAPLILRLFGSVKTYHKHDKEWDEYIGHFTELPGSRQIFDIQVDLVQTSCGMSVPLMDYKEDRNLLNEWAEKKSDEEMKAYHELKNTTSLDGQPTGILG